MIEIYKCCGLRVERPPEDDKTEYYTNFGCAVCVISKPLLKGLLEFPNLSKGVFSNDT